MLFKRVAVAMAFAAALLMVAPMVPASTDLASGDPAWGHFLSSKTLKYNRYDAGDSAIYGYTSTLVCTMAPLALAMGPAGAVVFGLSCGFVSVA